MWERLNVTLPAARSMYEQGKAHLPAEQPVYGRYFDFDMSRALEELHKALTYLDFGRLEQGELCLNRAIESADAAGESAVYIRAAVCYGEK